MKKILFFRFSKKGFTLVEALIAMSVLIIGIFSGFVLVTRALYNAAVIQDRLTASFLAQEGVELVRQIRDTNFIKILDNESDNWRDGLEDGNYIVEAKIRDGSSISLVPIEEGREAPNLLYNDDVDQRIYNHSIGEETVFNRKIKISSISGDQIMVEVIMNWKTRNIEFDLIVEDRLFNWLNLN
ncbi:MAG: prepilin-type N-terminal cleavage/methylation domain-containing protein [Candidatus Pacebacteria bacterium]|nr:prepilin-type N-terminal cleavage/methylation domain-containing protein [Candidatus Paceibacterota bacterium]